MRQNTQKKPIHYKNKVSVIVLKAYNNLHYDDEHHKIGHRWTFSDWTQIYYWNRFQRKWIKRNETKTKTKRTHSKQTNAFRKQRQKLWLENIEIESKLYVMDFYVSWTLCSISLSPVGFFVNCYFVDLFISSNIFRAHRLFCASVFFSLSDRLRAAYVQLLFLGRTWKQSKIHENALATDVSTDDDCTKQKTYTYNGFRSEFAFHICSRYGF